MVHTVVLYGQPREHFRRLLAAEMIWKADKPLKAQAIPDLRAETARIDASQHCIVGRD